MTDPMIMVQWADLTGRGFSPHEDGPPAPREFWTAAERLLQADLSQPPEGISSTVGHPVWTLRRVQVQGRWVWCFVVQGRRGPFGVAGTCRFAFGSGDMPALEAWTRGIEVAAGDQPRPPLPHHAEHFQFAVMQLLGGIVTGQPAVPVGGDPARAAAIIPAALKVLPERELRAWSFSTCLLQRPDQPGLRVAAGSWPEDFRREEPHRAGTIDQLFRHGPVSETEIKDRLKRTDVQRGFEVLVHYAATGRRPGPELLRGDCSLDDMLIELGHVHYVPTWQDVPAMLETPGGRRRLAEHHPLLVKKWALDAPGEAAGRLLDDLAQPLREALLAGLVMAQSGTPDNVLGLPTAARPEPTGWQERLASLLLATYPQPGQLRAVTYRWIGPAGVLGGFPDRIAARTFLRSLGLTPQDDPEYFPPDPRAVITELNAHQECSPAVAAEVLLAERPLRFLARLADDLEPLPGRTAGELLWLAALRDRAVLPEHEMRVLQPLARNLTRAGLRRQADEQWVDTMLGTVQLRLGGRRSGRLRLMMYGALEALLESDPEGPRSPSLVHRCRAIGLDNQATAGMATALRLAPGEPASATYRSQSWAHGDGDTGSFPVVGPPGGRRIRRRLHARLRRAGPRRPGVYLAGLLAAVFLLGSVWFVIANRTAAPPPPASAEVSATPPQPRRQSIRFFLPPLPRPSPQKDEEEFFRWFDKEVGTEPAVVVVVTYGGGDPGRSRDLKEALEHELGRAELQALHSTDPVPDKRAAGTLVATLYFPG